MSATDGAWIANALATWKFVSIDRLKLAPKQRPAIVTFDARCSYVSAPRDDGALDWKATPHAGKVTLPDGKQIPAAVVSFAAPLGTGDDGFFVMALPSIWRADPKVTSELGVEGLMTAVFLHEFMHAFQFYFVNPALDELTRKYHLAEDIGDDSLQEAFASNPEYVADYTAERDLLFNAASTPDLAEGKRLAREALARMRRRRARWFVGEAEKWGPLDDLFLTMEGLGQWTSYSWVRDARGPHLDEATALREVRRKGRYWTQDEGLALFLTIDRFVPGWQERAFAPHPETVTTLLAQASKE